MSAKIRHRWIKALKSNKYIQGRRALRHMDRYDPFGVLCDVMYPKCWKEWHQEHYLPSGIRHKVTYSHQLKKVLWEAQISDANYNLICKLNDVDQLSFVQIAEWLTQNI